MSHPADLIARVKALMLLGMSVKGAAAIAGVPHGTIRAWRHGWRRAEIPPDLSVKTSLVVAVKGYTDKSKQEYGHERDSASSTNVPVASGNAPSNSRQAGTS